LVSPDLYQTRQGQPLIVSAQAGLLRLDPNADPASTATSSLVEGPSHGTLTTFDDGSFVYNPNPGYLGTDTFTYRAGNPLGVGTVAITVFDTAPVAAADSYTVPHGRTFALGLGQGILSNDSDADGDRLSSRLITGPAHGTLALNPYGIFSYTPNPGFIGADSFTYVAGDGAMESAPALVALNVVDTAPGGQNRSYSTSPDLPLRITTGGLLEGATDPEGDTLSAILVAGPANGRVSLARDGSFGYLANQGFTGLDHFTFRITDGALESATYTASIQIAGAAPSTVDGQFSVVHDGTLFVPFDRGLSTLATSNNPNGTLSFALSAGPSHGTVTVYARGAFTYTPDAGYTGDDSLLVHRERWLRVERRGHGRDPRHRRRSHRGREDVRRRRRPAPPRFGVRRRPFGGERRGRRLDHGLARERARPRRPVAERGREFRLQPPTTASSERTPSRSALSTASNTVSPRWSPWRWGSTPISPAPRPRRRRTTRSKSCTTPP